MSAHIIDGRAAAAEIWAEVEAQTTGLTAQHGIAPRLAVVRVGDDPAAVWYERQIGRSFRAHGLDVTSAVLPSASQREELVAAFARLAADAATHGVLLQLPLPPSIRLDDVLDAMPLAKDVEGIHPVHAGLLALGRPRFVPSTPLGGMELLRRQAFDVAGRVAVVVGRSRVVGRPMAQLLLQADATVIACHSRTPSLAMMVRQADFVFAAAGRPRLITAEMIKPGAVIIDFGTTEVDGKLVGDVDFDAASRVASAITPVPGGTGPVTTAVLGRSLIEAATEQVGLPPPGA